MRVLEDDQTQLQPSRDTFHILMFERCKLTCNTHTIACVCNLCRTFL